MIGHFEPTSGGFALSGTWQGWRRWHVRAHLAFATAAADSFVADSGSLYGWRTIEVDWSMLSVAGVWTPESGLAAGVMPFVGWGVGLVHVSASETHPNQGYHDDALVLFPHMQTGLLWWLAQRIQLRIELLAGFPAPQPMVVGEGEPEPIWNELAILPSMSLEVGW